MLSQLRCICQPCKPQRDGRDLHGFEADRMKLTWLSSVLFYSLPPILLSSSITFSRIFKARKYMQNFETTHCTPLPASEFHLPWRLCRQDGWGGLIDSIDWLVDSLLLVRCECISFPEEFFMYSITAMVSGKLNITSDFQIVLVLFFFSLLSLTNTSCK